jgi:dCMP deaminase
MTSSTNSPTGKRADYLPWDAFFMGLAMLAAMRCKDPRTRNGACAVDPSTKRVLSLGYNGFPHGCSDDKFPWAGEAENEADTKYPYVAHAERNCLDNTRADLAGSHLYVFSERGYFPCAHCAQGILQHRLKRVVLAFVGSTGSLKYGIHTRIPTLRMFEAAGVSLEVMGAERFRGVVEGVTLQLTGYLSQIGGLDAESGAGP